MCSGSHVVRRVVDVANDVINSFYAAFVLPRGVKSATLVNLASPIVAPKDFTINEFSCSCNCVLIVC